MRYYWQQAESALASIAEALAEDEDYFVDLDAPAVIDRPSYGGLPWEVTPTETQTSLDTLLEPTDSALADVEGFLAGLEVVFISGSDVPRLQSAARELQSSLLAFRQEVQRGATSRRLETALIDVEDAWAETETLARQVAARRTLPNARRLERAGSAIEELRNQL
jgi:hypothetical protein